MGVTQESIYCDETNTEILRIDDSHLSVASENDSPRRGSVKQNVDDTETSLKRVEETAEEISISQRHD